MQAMGLIVTLLYILTAYLSPPTVFGPLAAFHLEFILAVIALLVSIPFLPRDLFKQPQMLAISGMLFAVFMSRLFTGWLGSAPRGIMEFLPDVFVYVLIVTHCRSKRSLQFVTLTLFLASCYVIARGALAVHAHDAHSPYIYSQGIGNEDYILRIRGLSIIGDPNDFAQVLVSLVPCMFFFAHPGRRFRNMMILVPAIAVLIAGLYLTHSRGAMLALVAVMVLAFRRKIGTIPAAILGGGALTAATALSWSGGRQISMEAGADRMDAWATGLELFKSHPLFGVGFKRFTDYNYITAHNSIVVCAAELGIIGFYFWVLFLVTSVRRGLSVSRGSVQHAEPQAIVPTPYWMATLQRGHSPSLANPSHSRTMAVLESPGPEGAAFDLSEPEVRRLAGLILIALAGFLVAGWFLSRAYVMWLFIYGGMTQSVLQMGQAKGISYKIDPLSRLLRMSAVAAASLLVIVYIILRVR